MRTPIGLPRRQRGATAVLAAITIVVLVGMLGLVIDLGVAYVRKTELQNAADAAALAGARELDGTAAGVGLARDQAIVLAAANGSDFAATPVAIGAANLRFGPGPEGPWSTVDNAIAAPQDKWFIRVDTTGIAQETRPTWFIRVLDEALASTTARGFAVAGRTLCEGIPIFACVLGAVDAGTGKCVDADCGFVRGTTYRLTAKEGANIAIGPGNIGWLDPVPPGSPGLISGTDDLRDLLCRGRAMCLSAPTTYTSLTQNAFNPTADALNTRFGIFPGPLNKPEYMAGENACLVDTNIKQYRYDDPDPGGPADWLDPDPTGQTDEEGGGANTGVRWSAVPAPAGTPGVVFPPAEPADPPLPSYPGAGAPYGQTAAPFAQAYAGPVPTQPGRRILTIGLAGNCGTINGSGKPVRIAAYGRFLLQRTAFETGADKGFYSEFMEVVPSGPVVRPGIKLYR